MKIKNKMISKTGEGHLLSILTMLIWGTTFISTKILLKSFSPVEILLFRFIFGYAALTIAFPHFIKPKSIKEELLFAATGFCGITLYYMLENTALTYTLASNVGIITSSAPFFTAILAFIFLKTEKPNAMFFVGFAAAIAGIFLINLNGSAMKLNPLGDALAILAALLWAVYSILMKKICANDYSTIAVTRRIFFYGIIFMIPFSLLNGVRFDIAKFVNAQNLFNLLFLALCASALCFVTWNFAVGVLGAIKTSVYIYMVPVITILFSALILHEKITPMAAAGAVLTLLGLFLSEQSGIIKMILKHTGKNQNDAQ